jgi:hypothetical protein
MIAERTAERTAERGCCCKGAARVAYDGGGLKLTVASGVASGYTQRLITYC